MKKTGALAIIITVIGTGVLLLLLIGLNECLQSLCICKRRRQIELLQKLNAL